jgi:death-on-curing protein
VVLGLSPGFDQLAFGSLSSARVQPEDLAALESAIAQPRATFDGIDLHANVTGKAAALAHSPALNHAFVDGNKRGAHAAMEVFLILNGLDLHADVDEQEAVFLELAAGRSSRRELEVWLERHGTEHRLSLVRSSARSRERSIKITVASPAFEQDDIVDTSRVSG